MTSLAGAQAPAGTVKGDRHLSDVIATDLLRQRSPRFPDYKAESEALTRLAKTFAAEPALIAQRLVDIAFQLTGAHSAGLSLEEVADGQPRFRWIATAGEFSRYLDGTMRRDFSPCQEVLDRDEAILMREPGRVYGDIDQLHAPIQEALLTPFHLDARPVGTVWLLSHDSQRQFDSEDLRTIELLADLAAIALTTVGLAGRLREARDESHRKDALLALVAHELRNPLAPIKNSVQLLRAMNTDERQARLLDVIDRQSNALNELVYDLTDAASVRNGKLTLRRAQTSIRDIVSRAIESATPQLEARSHRLGIHMPTEPLALTGDPRRLTQIFVNLLTNAAKYTPDGGTITITAVADEERLRVEIADSGVGISSDLLPHVFELFAQARQDPVRPKGGLGIGLFLVRELVQLHGGSVEAQSDGEGLGARFTVCLPLDARDKQISAL
jgi:signal transduction histidine kinase